MPVWQIQNCFIRQSRGVSSAILSLMQWKWRRLFFTIWDGLPSSVESRGPWSASGGCTIRCRTHFSRDAPLDCPFAGIFRGECRLRFLSARIVTGRAAAIVIAAVKISNESILRLSRTNIYIDFSAQIRTINTYRRFFISHHIRSPFRSVYPGRTFLLAVNLLQTCYKFFRVFYSNFQVTASGRSPGRFFVACFGRQSIGMKASE